MKDVSFLLRDRNGAVVQAWARYFEDTPNVHVSEGDIFDLEADGIVSPANSFGYMDGGIDLVYLQRFEWDLQDRLQSHLQQHHDGELPVGRRPSSKPLIPRCPIW